MSRLRTPPDHPDIQPVCLMACCLFVHHSSEFASCLQMAVLITSHPHSCLQMILRYIMSSPWRLAWQDVCLENVSHFKRRKPLSHSGRALPVFFLPTLQSEAFDVSGGRNTVQVHTTLQTEHSIWSRWDSEQSHPEHRSRYRSRHHHTQPHRRGQHPVRALGALWLSG